jgi:hypothetical protein
LEPRNFAEILQKSVQFYGIGTWEIFHDPNRILLGFVRWGLKNSIEKSIKNVVLFGSPNTIIYTPCPKASVAMDSM